MAKRGKLSSRDNRNSRNERANVSLVKSVVMTRVSLGSGSLPKIPDYKAYRGREENLAIPSHLMSNLKGSSDGSSSDTAFVERKEYTGNLIKGIAVMHKSNLVPVISDDEAVELAHMRR